LQIAWRNSAESVALTSVVMLAPDEWAERLAGSSGGYTCGIAHQIQCRENYDTLFELEKMGGKIRDTEDKWVGVEGRDEKTKFMISPRGNPFHDTNVVVRVWGVTFKPALVIYHRLIINHPPIDGVSKAIRSPLRS
jgi:hypothetical protein